MQNIYLLLVIWAGFNANLRPSQAKEVKLNAKDFQRVFLQKISETMNTAAKDYLNNFLREINTPENMQDIFELKLKLALESERLEPKIVFIKQYLDVAEHKDSSRENMYGLRNVNFLKKLEVKFHQIEEESLEEMHQLRFFYLCKQFKVKKVPSHNYYSQNTRLVAINDQNVAGMLNKLGLQDNHTISVNVSEFGKELYKLVNATGSEVINDYLIIIRKLLLEVLEPQSEEEVTTHSEALRKILIEIDFLLKTSDFYTKRQRLYDYLQNHLAVDYEQIQSSEKSQHDLIEIFGKLKEKGFDLVVAFLFSNFEFIDYLQDQWKLLLPQAPRTLYDERTRQLKQIQDLYTEFKLDFENSSKYDSYLEAVKLLNEQTQQDNADSSHIYEMLYSASQNVGSSRASLMISKCNEI